jgi:hypothetical protein
MAVQKPTTTTSHFKKAWGVSQSKQTLQNHSTLNFKSISRDGTVHDNLDEALPCCGILETGPEFDLLKDHITVWLKELWDAQMTPPSTPAIDNEALKTQVSFWYIIAFHGYGWGGENNYSKSLD